MSKICSRCRKTKPFSEYRKNAYHPDGYSSSCKVCDKKYYDENRETILRKKRERRMRPEEQEKERVSAREYRKKNSKMRVAKAREYHHAHPEWSREQARKYYREHRKERIAYQIKLKTRKKNLPATLTEKEWDKILAHHNFRCRYCGCIETPENLFERDHKVPLSKGGAYTKENIVPACRRCNSRKYNRSETKFKKILSVESQADFFD